MSGGRGRGRGRGHHSGGGSAGSEAMGIEQPPMLGGTMGGDDSEQSKWRSVKRWLDELFKKTDLNSRRVSEMVGVGPEVFEAWFTQRTSDPALTEKLRQLIHKYAPTLGIQLQDVDLQEERGDGKNGDKKVVVVDVAPPPPWDGGVLGSAGKGGDHAESIAPIRLDISAEGRVLRDTLLWHVKGEGLTPEQFARQVCEDGDLPASFEGHILRQMNDQINEFLNDGREDGLERVVDPTAYGCAGERLHAVRIELRVNDVLIEDRFLWDLKAGSNSPELFARQYCDDLQLPSDCTALIAHSIREQLKIARQKIRAGEDSGMMKAVRPRWRDQDKGLWQPSVQWLTPADKEVMERHQKKRMRGANATDVQHKQTYALAATSLLNPPQPPPPQPHYPVHPHAHPPFPGMPKPVGAGMAPMPGYGGGPGVGGGRGNALPGQPGAMHPQMYAHSQGGGVGMGGPVPGPGGGAGGDGGAFGMGGMG